MLLSDILIYVSYISNEVFLWLLSLEIATADMERQVINKSSKMCREAEFIKIERMRSGVAVPFISTILAISANVCVVSFAVVMLLCALLDIFDSYWLRGIITVKFANIASVRTILLVIITLSMTLENLSSYSNSELVSWSSCVTYELAKQMACWGISKRQRKKIKGNGLQYVS